MCGGGGHAAPAPTVDPAAERQKAADDAAKAANAAAATSAIRRRGQAGLLSSDKMANGSVLAQAFGQGFGSSLFSNASNVLGSAMKQGG